MAELNVPDVLLHGKVYDLLDIEGLSALTVAGEVVNRSSSFILPHGHTYSFDIKFSSTGSVNVKVELEQSMDDITYVIPDNKVENPLLVAIADETLHNVAYNPNGTPYARLKFTGLTGNHASTEVVVMRMYVVKN